MPVQAAQRYQVGGKVDAELLQRAVAGRAVAVHGVAQRLAHRGLHGVGLFRRHHAAHAFQRAVGIKAQVQVLHRHAEQLAALHRDVSAVGIILHDLIVSAGFVQGGQRLLVTVRPGVFGRLRGAVLGRGAGSQQQSGRQRRSGGQGRVFCVFHPASSFAAARRRCAAGGVACFHYKHIVVKNKRKRENSGLFGANKNPPGGRRTGKRETFLCKPGAISPAVCRCRPGCRRQRRGSGR